MCRQQVSSEINFFFPPQGTVFPFRILSQLLKSAGEQMLLVAVTEPHSFLCMLCKNSFNHSSNSFSWLMAYSWDYFWWALFNLFFPTCRHCCTFLIECIVSLSCGNYSLQILHIITCLITKMEVTINHLWKAKCMFIFCRHWVDLRRKCPLLSCGWLEA